MNFKAKTTFIAAVILLAPEGLLRAQAPLAKPLAEFDTLVAKLQSGSLVSEPVQAGNVTVVPYAAIQFGAGSAGVMIGYGGGMSGKVVPLGALIVEGDDVRVEQIPEQDGPPSMAREILKAILERKVVFMGNGLNIGNAPGQAQDLAPMLAAMMGQTTVMGNALNLGTLTSRSKGETESGAEVRKLMEAKNFSEALPMVNTLLAKDPKNAALQKLKTQILDGMGGTQARPKTGSAAPPKK